MCDDYGDSWDDMDDVFYDPSNDFEEDMSYEACGDWYEDAENLIDESDAKTSVASDDKQDPFDLANAMLLGMIGGAFYDAATEDKQRMKRAKSEDKYKK